jgi:SET domain-containing protein
MKQGSRYNAVQIAEDAHLVERPEVAEGCCGSLNHSCDSNLWMSEEATVVTRRDIAAGEELTLDYAMHTRIPSGSWTARATAALCSVVAPCAGATGGYGSFETGTGATSPPSSTSE